jgi:hypothetical protein
MNASCIPRLTQSQKRRFAFAPKIMCLAPDFGTHPWVRELYCIAGFCFQTEEHCNRIVAQAICQAQSNSNGAHIHDK